MRKSVAVGLGAVACVVMGVGARAVVAEPKVTPLPSAWGINVPDPRKADQVVDRVVVVVGHRIITSHAVDLRMIPYQKQIDATPVAERGKRAQELRAQLVEGMVSEILIENTAAAMKLSVADSEIQAALEAVQKQNQLDAAGLVKAVEESGMTQEAYRAELRRQILQARVQQSVVYAKVKAKRTDEAAFQREYEELFRQWLVSERKNIYIEVKP